MNMIVLFGLILSVGMLVDGAIIVVEYADRKMAEGFDKRQAYAMASGRMLWPVITSITTILVVFFPLVFWPGVVGEFMKYLPYTLLATLSASLVMALIFIPTLGSLFGKLSQKHKSAIQMILLSEKGDLSKLQGLPATYYRALRKALESPKMVVGGAVGLLALSVIAYGQLGKGVEFFPDVDPDRAVVIIRNPGNTSIEQKDAIVRQVEERVLKIPDFTCVYTTTIQSSMGSSTHATEDTIGHINVEFDNWENRRKAKVVLADLENQMQDIPGVAIEIQKEQSGPGGSKPIVIELTSSDHTLLKREFLRLKGYVNSLQGITGVEDNLPTPGITWEFTVNRAEAARLGADIATIGNAIKLATNGIVVTKYRPNDSREEVDIVVRYDAKNRSLNDLDRLKVQTAHGLVPISAFVKKEPKQRLSMVHRVDGNRVLTLKADVKSGYLVHDAIQSIKGWVDGNLADGSVHVNYKGEEADKGETSSFLAVAFGSAIFMMAVILVTQFNSFFSMMLVLSSVVMSTIGVFIGLIVMRVPFSIVMCGIGVIALAGIIVSNNIILIDTFDQLSKQFSDKKEAILRTGIQRLRPVILTKLTAILGLLPIMFRIDIDYISMSVHMGSPATMWWQQIAISIVFGVAFASILTLFVTPSALMIRENIRLKKKAKNIEL
jgi:multidrug efflux pump